MWFPNCENEESSATSTKEQRYANTSDFQFREVAAERGWRREAGVPDD